MEPCFARFDAFDAFGAFALDFPTRDSTYFRNVGSNPLNSRGGMLSGSVIQRSGTVLPFQANTRHPSRNTAAGPSPRLSSFFSFRESSTGRSDRIARFSN